MKQPQNRLRILKDYPAKIHVATATYQGEIG